MSNYRITFSKPLPADKCELSEKYSYSETEGPSDDGRRAYSHSVDVNNVISFTKRKKEAEGYSYNVEYAPNGNREYSLIKNDSEYSSKYCKILGTLVKNGVDLRDILDPIMISNVNISQYGVSKHELRIKGDIKPLLDKDCNTTIAEIKESVNSKDEQIKRAFGVRSYPEFKEVKGHFSDLGEVRIDSLGIWATMDAHEKSLDDFSRAEINDWLKRYESQGYNDTLPPHLVAKYINKETAKVLLSKEYTVSQEKREGRDLYRKYMPELLNTSLMTPEECRKEDISIIISQGAHIGSDAQKKICELAIQDPKYKEEILRHSDTLFEASDSEYVSKLFPEPADRKVIAEKMINCENPAIADEALDMLPLLDGVNLSRSDLSTYIDELVTQRRNYTHDYNYSAEPTSDQLKSIINIARNATENGHTLSDTEISPMMEKIEISNHERYKLSQKEFYEVYKELNFTPGIERLGKQIEAKEAKKREEKRREEAEKKKATDNLNSLIKGMGSPILERKFLAEKADKLFEMNEWEVNRALDNIPSVKVSAKSEYLVFPELIKNMGAKPTIDINERDAALVIGKAGANIKQLQEDLNNNGCHIRRINVETHSREEMDELKDKWSKNFENSRNHQESVEHEESKSIRKEQTHEWGSGGQENQQSYEWGSGKTCHDEEHEE